MTRKTATVSQYLSALAPRERAEISKVRRVIRRNLPKGYREAIQWGMICYSVPLSRFSDTYNKEALCYAALATQKHYNTLYLMTVYGSPAEEKRFRARYKATGRKLDMGRSCVRFKSADDLPLDLIGRTIASTTVNEFVSRYKKGRARRAPARPAAKKKAAKKKTAKRRTAKKR